MNKTFLTLTLLLGTSLSGGALAADATQDILAQPSMSQISYPEGQTPQKIAPKAIQVPQEQAANKSDLPSAPDKELKKATKPEPSADDYVVEILPPSDAPHTSMLDVFARGYVKSPYLRAERESLRSQYENVAQARSYMRPNVSLSGGAQRHWAEYTPGGKNNFTARNITLSASEYLYRGGRTLAQIEQMLRASKSAQAAYGSAVQGTILNIATAALDLQRDRATIDLTKKNHEVIAKQLQSTQRSFEVGELTRTDVAQAKARLSGAEADLVAAEASLATSLARFKQYAGFDGTDLVLDLDTPTLPLPQTLAEAQSRAEAQNPDIQAANYAYLSAQSGVDEAFGKLLPEIALSAALTKAWEPTAALDDSRDASVGLSATLPIYAAGASRSLIRQAKLGVYEQKNRLEDARRAVQSAVSTAWSQYEAARTAIQAYKKQVEAAKLAREGVYKEREVGQRTVLDTLNADAELLDAQVGLVSARRNAVVAAYALMGAVGGLTGEALGIVVDDEHLTYLDTAQSTVFDTDINPLPADDMTSDELSRE